MINRSQVRSMARARLHNDCGQVVHTRCLDTDTVVWVVTFFLLSSWTPVSRSPLVFFFHFGTRTYGAKWLDIQDALFPVSRFQRINERHCIMAIQIPVLKNYTAHTWLIDKEDTDEHYYSIKKIKVAHTRVLSVVPELIPVLGSQPAGDVSHKPVGCHYFPPGLQLTSRPLRGLLPISLLGEQRPFCAWVQHANHSATEPPTTV